MEKDTYNKNAFTILELLVVVSIIAILIGIAVPSYMSIRDKARIARVKDEVRYIAAAYRNYLMDQKTWPSEVNDGNPHDIAGAYYSMLTGKYGTVYFEFRNYQTNYPGWDESFGALDLFSPPDNQSKWRAYKVIFDHDYDNHITYKGKTIRVPVGVFAIITDRVSSVDYDITSWE